MDGENVTFSVDFGLSMNIFRLLFALQIKQINIDRLMTSQRKSQRTVCATEFASDLITLNVSKFEFNYKAQILMYVTHFLLTVILGIK